MKKHILVDADGVLLRWEEGFNSYMNTEGYIRLPYTETEYSIALRYGIPMSKAQIFMKEYNESAAMRNLAPFADSVEYVSKLAALGFRFTVITSLSDHPDAKTYRTENLHNLFGYIFDDVVCLEQGISKASILMRWADTRYFWIEDHMRQALAGYEAGLRPILINHPYNNHYTTDLFPIVEYDSPWKEIYKIICNDYGIA